VEQLIDQVESKKEKVNFIFMVGGFSESPFLKAEIIKRFETDQIQVSRKFSQNTNNTYHFHLGISSAKTSNFCDSRCLHVRLESSFHHFSNREENLWNQHFDDVR